VLRVLAVLYGHASLYDRASVICQPKLLCVQRDNFAQSPSPTALTDRVSSVQTADEIENGKPIYINGKNFGTSDHCKVPKGQWSTTLILLLVGVIFIAPIVGFMSVRTRESRRLCLQYRRL